MAAYETASHGTRLEVPDDPGHRLPVTSKEIDSGIVKGAKESGAEIATSRIVKPLHLAAAVTLLVDDPATYLKHRLVTFLDAVPSPTNRQYDGLYVLVADRNGKYVWFSASTVSQAISGRTHGSRPDLEGCDPIIGPAPRTEEEPPPCPVD